MITWNTWMNTTHPHILSMNSFQSKLVRSRHSKNRIEWTKSGFDLFWYGCRHGSALPLTQPCSRKKNELLECFNCSIFNFVAHQIQNVIEFIACVRFVRFVRFVQLNWFIRIDRNYLPRPRQGSRRKQRQLYKFHCVDISVNSTLTFCQINGTSLTFIRFTKFNFQWTFFLCVKFYCPVACWCLYLIDFVATHTTHFSTWFSLTKFQSN